MRHVNTPTHIDDILQAVANRRGVPLNTAKRVFYSVSSTTNKLLQDKETTVIKFGRAFSIGFRPRLYRKFIIELKIKRAMGILITDEELNMARVGHAKYKSFMDNKDTIPRKLDNQYVVITKEHNVFYKDPDKLQEFTERALERNVEKIELEEAIAENKWKKNQN